MSVYLYIPFTLTPRMRWVGHMACTGDRRVALEVFCWGDLSEEDHLED